MKRKYLALAAALIALAVATPAAAQTLSHGRLGSNLYTARYLERLAAKDRRAIPDESRRFIHLRAAVAAHALIAKASVPVTLFAVRDRAAVELPTLVKSERRAGRLLAGDRRQLAQALRWHRRLYLFGGIEFFSLPPHASSWLCIHRYEGSWRDTGDPYWGGLQMDHGFMSSYAPAWLLRRGPASAWSPLEQMWVAERALRHGRDFSAWPNTARICGLI